MSKTLTDEMVCFQQAARNYLDYIIKNKVVMKLNSLDPKNGGDV